MLTALTPKQTANLINEGADPSKATCPYTYNAPYRTSGIGVGMLFSFDDLQGIAIPTLCFLDESYHLTIRFTEDKKWHIVYRNPHSDVLKGEAIMFSTLQTEIIDALYEATVFALKFQRMREDKDFSRYIGDVILGQLGKYK